MTPWLPCRFAAEAGRDRDGVGRAEQSFTLTPAPIGRAHLNWSQFLVRELRKTVGFDSKTNPADPLAIPFGIEKWPRMRWVHAIGARVGVMWAGRRWGTGSGCRIGRRHRHLDTEPPVSGGARSLRELRVLHPQGSAYVDLVVRYRDLEDLGSLTASHVRVEAGHLSAGLGVQRRDVVARCSPDVREVPAYEKRAAREHDVEDVWTDIAATADVRIELNVGIAGRTRDLGDLVARFAPDRREVTARIDIVTGNLERSDPARNHAVEGIRVEGLPSPVDEAGNGVQLREIDARLTADRGEVAADVDV